MPRLRRVTDLTALGGRLALSLPETADILGISPSHAEHLARTGDLPTIRLGRRILVPRVQLEALMAGTAATTTESA